MGVTPSLGIRALFPGTELPRLKPGDFDMMPLRRASPLMAIVFEYAADWGSVWTSQKLLVDDFMDQIRSITPQVGGVGTRWKELMKSSIDLMGLGDAWSTATYLIRLFAVEQSYDGVSPRPAT